MVIKCDIFNIKIDKDIIPLQYYRYTCRYRYKIWICQDTKLDRSAVMLTTYCHWKSSYQEGEGWDHTNQFNPTTFCVPVQRHDLDFQSHISWGHFYVNRFGLNRIFVFNATFSNISAISCQPVIVVEEAGVSGENHRPWTSN